MTIKRRPLVAAVSGLALLGALGAARAQSSRTPRIGMLLLNAPASEPLAPLLEALKAAGYERGRTVDIEYRHADGRPERLPTMAAELASLAPDVIFALGGDVVPFARAATRSIPIVAFMSNDPVKSGLAASIGRPGGNVTGITLIFDELAGKTLGYLKAAVPALARVAVLWNPDHADQEFQETRKAAEMLKVRVQSLEVRGPDDLDGAFRAALAERAEALVIVPSRLMSQGRQRIVEFAARNRVILAGGWGEWTKDGALLTYGPNIPELMQHAAIYIAKILRGARPNDLPMERPTRFELVINLGTARAFGLTLAPTLLAQADRLI